MRKGDIYVHTASRGYYMFKGVVAPYPGFNGLTQVGTLFKATHSETEEEVQVLMLPMQDVYISGLDHPTVLYKSHKDGRLWVRPVDMFFGNNDYGAKRFMLYNPGEPQ